MKMLNFVLILGGVFMYFMNIAMLKTPILNMEWAIHAGIRFLAGFLVLGISCFYAHAMTIKKTLQVALLIITLDYLYDYYVGNYRLNFQIILHGIYMVVWGALVGYLTAKQFNKEP